MPVHLLVVPYDSGHRGLRMGRGPLHLTSHGAAARLEAAGHTVAETLVEADPAVLAEIRAAFELNQALAARVGAARAAGQFPLVLSGNCNSAVGVAAGLLADQRQGAASPPLGVVWLDAHADFNTPESTSSGFLDGMALAMLTGRCWTTMTASVRDFRPLPDRQVVLVGARDLDDQERVLLDQSALTWVNAEQVRREGVAAALGPALAALRERVAQVHVHIDLDVHDPAYAPANAYPAPDGLTPEQVREVVRLVAGQTAVRAATLAAYDPGCDVQDRMLNAGLDLIELFGSVAEEG